MTDCKTDCRSEVGITVGLIDSMISIARVLAYRDFTSSEVQEALADLRSDEDVARIINAVEVLRTLAKIVANDKSILFKPDWGFGTATLIIDDKHCHIGCDSTNYTDDENFNQFVLGLHRVLTDVANNI